jgi:hypothetical protein
MADGKEKIRSEFHFLVRGISLAVIRFKVSQPAGSRHLSSHSFTNMNELRSLSSRDSLASLALDYSPRGY